MDNRIIIDSIVENLFYAIPVIHKKLMKIDPPDIHCGIFLSRLNVGIMAMLNDNSVPISEIARAFFIPKPQMTYLIDRMVEAGLVERTHNSRDRRITLLVLTPKGKTTFRQCDSYIKNNVRGMLSSLSLEQLTDLLESLIKLKEIGPKLGSGKLRKGITGQEQANTTTKIY
jgi:DNA-binding MarR family transcriptional regulator